MTTAIAHRGPDGEGFHVDGAIGLGHRRLSIIDLDGGAQPISNEDDTIHVVFNGEIYNFVELRKELEDRGHRFKTRSDTEVILHGYEEWGLDCVDALQRHVRVRALGFAASAAVPRARPPGHQAAVLHADRRPALPSAPRSRPCLPIRSARVRCR